VVIEEAPRSARPGDVITLRGRLLAGASDPVLNLSYERLPCPMSLDALRIFIPYSSPAQYLNSIPILVNEDGSFQIDVALREFEGMYHIRIWVVVNGIQVLVTDYIVWVTQP